jgi:hypothetical protein
MTDAPVLPFRGREGTRPAASAGSRSTAPALLGARGGEPIEIAAPDRYCAALLLGYAAPVFAAELVAGSPWTIRLELPPTGGQGMAALLALLERWLESAGLPCAAVRCGGRSYLIRADRDGEARDAGWSATRSEPATGGTRGGMPLRRVELDPRRDDRRRAPADPGGVVISIETRQGRAFSPDLSPQPA